MERERERERETAREREGDVNMYSFMSMHMATCICKHTIMCIYKFMSTHIVYARSDLDLEAPYGAQGHGHAAK